MLTAASGKRKCNRESKSNIGVLSFCCSAPTATKPGEGVGVGRLDLLGSDLHSGIFPGPCVGTSTPQGLSLDK